MTSNPEILPATGALPMEVPRQLTRETSAALGDVALNPDSDGHWQSRAACRNFESDLFFPGEKDKRGAEKAKRVCAGCPVRGECLQDAIENRLEFGVWGGMTERERRALIRKTAKARRSAL